MTLLLYVTRLIMVFCYIGAKLIALLEPEKTEYAANMLCKVDSTFSGVEIKVSFIESQKKGASQKHFLSYII